MSLFKFLSQHLKMSCLCQELQIFSSYHHLIVLYAQLLLSSVQKAQLFILPNCFLCENGPDLFAKKITQPAKLMILKLQQNGIQQIRAVLQTNKQKNHK